MKKIIAILCATLNAIVANAATWTVHAFSDNYTYAQVIGPCIVWPDNGATRAWTYYPQWDLAWDQIYPSSADSGVQADSWAGGEYDGHFQTVVTPGFADSWTLTDITESYPGITLTEFGMEIWVMVSGPAPDYGNYWNNWANVSMGMAGGEWWFDFASDGTARISTAQPLDFGKWAWDGSINPSWVEAAAPDPSRANHGKHLGQGK